MNKAGGTIGKIFGQEKNITTYNLARMNLKSAVTQNIQGVIIPEIESLKWKYWLIDHNGSEADMDEHTSCHLMSQISQITQKFQRRCFESGFHPLGESLEFHNLLKISLICGSKCGI